jgi:prepilin-type N-terminal cleavage/methylation domain-containing protein
MNVKAVTLMELMVVVIIIGVLATLALPAFRGMKERALNKEAMANLKLIQAAERIYRMEYGVYRACGNTGVVKTQLKLDLSDQNWEYRTTVPGGDLDARATRDITRGAPAAWVREFGIDEIREEACCVSGNCPSDMPTCPGGP